MTDTTTETGTAAVAATPGAPQQSTSLTALPAPRAPLHPAAEERRNQSRIAAQISGQTWGKMLDHPTRYAFANYMIRNGLELDEVEILGGRIYKNGTYYLNRAQPLVRAGVIEIRHEFINHDTRLDALARSEDKDVAARAKAGIERRLLLRIEHNAPEDQPAVVAAYLKIVKTGKELVGVNWCGRGGKNSKGNLNDPVGDDEPTKTAITRAYRRVLRMGVGHEPQIAQFVELGDGEDVEALEQKVAESREAIRAQEQPRLQHPQPVIGSYDEAADAAEDAELSQLGPTDAQVERLLDLAAHRQTPAPVKENIETRLREKRFTRAEAMTWITTLEAGISGEGEQ